MITFVCVYSSPVFAEEEEVQITLCGPLSPGLRKHQIEQQ